MLEAAVKEFAASGYHAASTGAIAKRAGISQPYIYALFPNKRELFLATHRGDDPGEHRMGVEEVIRGRFIRAKEYQREMRDYEEKKAKDRNAMAPGAI